MKLRSIKKGSQVITVAGFTFRDAVRKKAFWITNIIYAVLVLGACLVLPRTDMLGGGGDMSFDMGGMNIDLSSILGGAGNTCYFLDNSANPLLDGAADALRSSGMDVIEIAACDLGECLDAVRERSDAGAVYLSPEQPPQATVYTKDLMSRFPADAVDRVLNTVYRLNQFNAAGFDADASQSILQSGLLVATSPLKDISGMVVGMALMLLMFMTIYVYGYGVAMSVATEKSTRVMETLIVSAKPSRILIGKCVGMGAAGLAQLVGTLGFAALCSKLFMPPGGLGFGLPEMSFELAGLLVLYFLLGFALFAMINSMCGAMVSKMEDLQSAMMPAALVSVFSFYGGYGSTFGGGGLMGRMTMLIPFTAPYAAPGVLLSGEYDMRLIAASVGILLAAIALVSWISGKVYSASVLHYGSRLKFGEVRRMIRGK